MRILSPKFLILLAFLQVCIAYLTNMETTATQYSISLNYLPLLLWFLAFVFVALGAELSDLIFRYKGGLAQANYKFKLLIYNININKLNILYLFSFCGLITTSLLIVSDAGVIPIVAIISQSKGIGELNKAQADSLPGLYGLHSLMTFLMEYIIGLLLFKSIFDLNNKTNVRILWGGLIVFIATIIGGKRQDLAIFICFISVALWCSIKINGGLITRHHKKILRRFFGVVLLSLAAIAYISFSRLDAAGYGDETVNEPLRYISMPLINLESLSETAGWVGLEPDIVKPLDFLLPAKIGVERGVATIPVPEPTSPSGFFSMAYLYWGGIVGLIIYSFFVGIFSGYIYNKAASSPMYLLFYGYIVWSLLMSHTYNHFLTITFLPLQFLLLVAVNYFIFNRSSGRAIDQIVLSRVSAGPGKSI